MERRRIVIDCRMAQSSGIGVYIKNLVPRCIRRMPDTDFIVVGAEEEPQWLPRESSNVDYFVCGAPIYSVREQLALSSIARKVSALWVPHFNVPLCSQAKLIVTVHDVAPVALPDIFGTLKGMYAKFFFSHIKKYAQHIIFNSYFTKSEFEKYIGIPQGDNTVTHLGIDESWFASGAQASPFPWPYIIAVGNMKPHKNLRMLAETFAEMCGEVPHHLVFVGTKEGLRTSISAESVESLAPERIHCTGHVDFTALQNMVRHASLLVFPSLYEGFGFPPLEAMACGIRVLVADIPVLREVCGDAASYADATSKVDLRQRLLQCLQTSDHTFQARGVLQAQKYVWEDTAQRTEKILRAVMTC